jgi:methionine sulfoxide reductase heme-binding subunit
MSSLATAVTPHLFWITSRAAGTAALLLSSVSVCVGLAIGIRVLGTRKSDLRIAHEALSLATIATLLVHVFALLGDGFLKPSVADLTVPFVSGYETVWTTLGIVAFWAMLVLGLSYYARARIGVQRWRLLHRLVALAWLLGLAHSLGEGTDAGQLWFLAMVAIAAAPAIGLLLVRWLKRSKPLASSNAAAPPASIGAVR